METVNVHCQIATDGSGFTLSSSIKPFEAYVVKHPEETYWGKYRVLIPLESIVERYDESEATLRENLPLTEVDGIEGMSFSADKMYIGENV